MFIKLLVDVANILKQLKIYYVKKLLMKIFFAVPKGRQNDLVVKISAECFPGWPFPVKFNK
jgi:hypothetical protein